MSDFFTNLFNKSKGILTALGAALLAFIGYKLLSQESEIKTLEQDNAQAQAENVIQKKEGELNEIQKQTTTAENTLNTTINDLKSNESKLAVIRRNRP